MRILVTPSHLPPVEPRKLEGQSYCYQGGLHFTELSPSGCGISLWSSPSNSVVVTESTILRTYLIAKLNNLVDTGLQWTCGIRECKTCWRDHVV